MFKTKVTETLGIKYPIIQGGMMWLSKAELASAVSNAGGLGIITALSFDKPEKLADEIDKCKSLTDKPFGVNITFLPTLRPVNYDAYIDVIIEKGIKIMETAGRNPEPYMKKLKDAGIKVIHKCTSIRHAKKAEAIGCDFVSIDGFECAGHPGEDDVTSLILIPRAADELNIPVIASGGFGDARGFLAALALGAEGVNMGTRFVATKEAPAHENIKKKLVEAKETDTILVERSLKNTLRALKNKHALKIKEMEEKGATLEELAPLLSGLRGLKALQTGELDDALFACGQVVGLINDIPTVKELIEGIISEAEKILKEKMCKFI
ncbi:nitronate monooxygenase [Thermotomaculum hydrothermale]|uniref:Nitronate monooxygenase n=1 Tax=Thermotomaculum hydrothermale TaxID=981385 RepID=A0A7R6PYZ0_9BACT|nr:nitronate monooxygenase [Thermotomaculum hydrothermale]BBB32233.1 nitronate monooxygenase [Thermotomaculum hydrothermale]